MLTATEALSARRLGCRAEKLYPAGPVGPGYVKALRGPIAGVAIVPTGGIGLGDVRARTLTPGPTPSDGVAP